MPLIRAARVLALGLALVATAGSAAAQTGADATGPATAQPNYLTSPFHGARDGDGRVIPCRCRSGGHDYRLGDLVCMQTVVGIVLARCDLQDNNTSWIPTGTPCQLSQLPQSPLPGTRATVAERRR